MRYGWLIPFLASVVFGFVVLLAREPLPHLTAEEARPEADKRIRLIQVINNRAPDCTSLQSIVASVTRDCKTNDEKAIALYNFMRLTHYHRAYPSERDGLSVLKEINCYGWSLCGGLHAEQSALWRELGWKWRFVGWPGHTTVEAFYDDRWHYLDVFLKFYAWMPDPSRPGQRTIAGEDDLQARPQELLLDAFVLDPARKVYYARDNRFEMIGDKANWQAPAFLVCGDGLAGIADALKHKNRAGSPEGWASINHASGSYSADIHLAPGFALTNSWDSIADAWFWADSKVAPCHTCGDKEVRNSPEKGPIVEPYFGSDWKCESYANGEITVRPDLTRTSFLQSFIDVENVQSTPEGLVPTEPGKPARVTLLLQSPYLLTRGSGTATGCEQVEISIDAGKTWKAAPLNDFSSAIKGQTEARVRIPIAKRLEKLELRAIVQNNPFALPFLAPGKNTLTVSVADPRTLGDNRLVVTYAYRKGVRRKSYEELCQEDKELGRGHDASWSTTPTVVQKVFTAQDLPAQFEIDIGTPGEFHPVYPRMLYVRREILGPEQKPLPTPVAPTAPTLAVGEALKTLPNPLLVGTQPPPPRKVRPVKTVRHELKTGHFLTQSGQLVADQLLRWPKNKQEKIDPVVYAINGIDAQLPAIKELAAARVVFPVVRSHQKAPTRIGICELNQAITGKTFDVSKIDTILSSTTLPVLAEDAPSWNPPREFSIDVTRLVRDIIRTGTQFPGLALRVVPDRAIDDGWTVRAQLPADPRLFLEIDIYASKPK